MKRMYFPPLYKDSTLNTSKSSGNISQWGVNVQCLWAKSESTFESSCLPVAVFRVSVKQISSPNQSFNRPVNHRRHLKPETTSLYALAISRPRCEPPAWQGEAGEPSSPAAISLTIKCAPRAQLALPLCLDKKVPIPAPAPQQGGRKKSLIINNTNLHFQSLENENFALFFPGSKLGQSVPRIYISIKNTIITHCANSE